MNAHQQKNKNINSIVNKNKKVVKQEQRPNPQIPLFIASLNSCTLQDYGKIMELKIAIKKN